MMHRWKILCLTGALVLAALSGMARAQDVVTVEATGEGVSEDEARNDALRKALEQGAGVEIASHSEVENFELIRDTIYARSEGVVTEFKVLKKEDGAGGLVYVTIQAKVDKNAVASTWAAVQNVLDQMGQPGIMVFISEHVDNVPMDESMLEAAIADHLLESGFRLFSRAQKEALRDKRIDEATRKGDLQLLQSLANDFGAEIFITGTADANAAGMSHAGGLNLAMYNCDAVVKMYYTDTAELLVTKSLPAKRGGARNYKTHSRQAGRVALKNAGEDLVKQVYTSVMKQWSTRISAGGYVELEVRNVSMGDAIKIKKKLADIPKVERVNGPKFSNKVATFRIQAKMTAQTMVEYLVTEEWEQLFEIDDLQMNRILAKGKD
jgi:hypothetical protein